MSQEDFLRNLLERLEKIADSLGKFNSADEMEEDLDEILGSYFRYLEKYFMPYNDVIEHQLEYEVGLVKELRKREHENFNKNTTELNQFLLEHQKELQNYLIYYNTSNEDNVTIEVSEELRSHFIISNKPYQEVELNAVRMFLKEDLFFTGFIVVSLKEDKIIKTFEI